MSKENLTPVFEAMFGTSKIDSKEKFDELLAYMKSDEGGKKIDTILDSIKEDGTKRA